MNDFGVLLLRLVTGGLIAGHGSQKLLGAFDGPGLDGTAGFMESLGLQPGKAWGTAAALSESAGALTALGFLHPLGPIGTIAAMAIATKVHSDKPIWANAGGSELPVINLATALALILIGPGNFSLDHAFGIRLPRPLVIVLAALATVLVAYALSVQPPPRPAQASDEAHNPA